MGQKINVSIGDDDDKGGGFLASVGTFLSWLVFLVFAIPMFWVMVEVIVENHDDDLYDSKVIDTILDAERAIEGE